MIKAMNGCVVLETVSEENTTASGIVFQEESGKNVLKAGKVVSGKIDDGVDATGMVVFYPQDKSWSISSAGEVLTVVKTSDVLAYRS